MSPFGWSIDALLAVLLVGLAWQTTASRDLFTSMVLYIVYGLLMAVVWIRLGIPDVALAEAAVGAGLTGVLLLGALSRIRDHASAGTGDETGDGSADDGDRSG